MSKKKKIIVISSSVIGGMIALIILLSFTLFAVRNIDVDFKSSRMNFTATNEEIVEASGIKNGGTVLFQNKEEYISNLEKNYPYIKVVNIETIFPSKLVIHVVERSEIYAFKFGEKYLICDNELKVLKIVDEFDSDRDNPIFVKGVTIENKEYAPSDFLKIRNFVDVYAKLYENNRILSEQQSIIKEIEFVMERDDVYKKDTLSAKLTLFNGQTFKIKNCEKGLLGKMRLFVDVFSQEFDFIGKTITTKDGVEVVLTEDDLISSTIEINNYYDFTQHEENECYFDIILA